MDDRLRREVLGFIEGLAIREKDRLAALGTFAEIEDLTAEIGDEVARQLARFELTRRAEAMTATGVHACPECGKEAPVEREPEPFDPARSAGRDRIQRTDLQMHPLPGLFFPLWRAH